LLFASRLFPGGLSGSQFTSGALRGSGRPAQRGWSEGETSHCQQLKESSLAGAG
jgi:hypothetical protein